MGRGACARRQGRVRGKALEGRAGGGRGGQGGGPRQALPEEERPVHLVRLVVVALLDAGPQLALHALHAAAVPAAAFRGFLLRRHDRRRHQRGGGRGRGGRGDGTGRRAQAQGARQRPRARLPPAATAAGEGQAGRRHVMGEGPARLPSGEGGNGGN